MAGSHVHQPMACVSHTSKEEIAEYLLISTCATGEDALFAHGYFYRLIKPNFLDFCLDFVFSVLLGARKAYLAYCPSSNMFLADGVTDLPRMMRSGVNVALGSDGACSNNCISVFEEMRMATLLQKVVTHNAACVHHRDVFKMGTQNGADLLQLPAGRIGAGYDADFVGVNAGEQLLPNIVYSMQPSAVQEVIIGGRAVIHKGNYCTVTEGQVLDTVKRTLWRVGG